MATKKKSVIVGIQPEIQTPTISTNSEFPTILYEFAYGQDIAQYSAVSTLNFDTKIKSVGTILSLFDNNGATAQVYNLDNDNTNDQKLYSVILDFGIIVPARSVILTGAIKKIVGGVGAYATMKVSYTRDGTNWLTIDSFTASDVNYTYKDFFLNYTPIRALKIDISSTLNGAAPTTTFEFDLLQASVRI